MALGATVYRIEIALSDVDRSVYETFDLRIARHPSESARSMLTRVLAYALSYEEGIAFSKGGLSSTDDPPLAVHDRTGLLLAWIDVGSPSAERLHRASKAAPRVQIYTYANIGQLRKEASSRTIHRMDAIDVWCLDAAWLDSLEPRVDRHTKFELTRSDARLYLTIGGQQFETEIARTGLTER